MWRDIDLGKLSPAEKDALISSQGEQLDTALARIAVLEQRLEKLTRSPKTPGNSSLPPSSAGNTRMNPQIVGTPVAVADHLQDLFESECCDGFVVCPAISPGGYTDFCRSVVPELQRRGIFRTAYAGLTFREHLQQAL